MDFPNSESKSSVKALYRGNGIAPPGSLSALLLPISDAVAMLADQAVLFLICHFNYIRKTSVMFEGHLTC